MRTAVGRTASAATRVPATMNKPSTEPGPCPLTRVATAPSTALPRTMLTPKPPPSAPHPRGSRDPPRFAAPRDRSALRDPRRSGAEPPGRVAPARVKLGCGAPAWVKLGCGAPAWVRLGSATPAGVKLGCVGPAGLKLG